MSKKHTDRTPRPGIQRISDAGIRIIRLSVERGIATQVELAKIFGVSEKHISRIVSGHARRGVK